MSIVKTNNEEQKAHHIFRLSDIVDEPIKVLPPIIEYEDMPLVSLETAVEPLISFLPSIQSYAKFAKQRCKDPPPDNLTIDESASIMLYSIGWEPYNKCLHIALNDRLQSKDRDLLQPWLLYLKLFTTALSRLPSVNQNVYRSIKSDISKAYQIGETFIWWGFSSCTSLINVLQSEQFFNMTIERTLFTIDSYSAKDIRQHSYYQSEEEFIFLPATQFNVQANFKQSNSVHSIRLQEIQAQSNTNVAVNQSKTDQSSTITAKQETEQSDIKPEPASKSLQDDGIFAGGKGWGPGLHQLSYPGGVRVDDDETIYIADSSNHRIMKWKSGATEGQVVAGGNGGGDKMNQLNWPVDVIIDRENNSLIIADKRNRRVVRWPRENGTEGEIIISNIDCFGLAMNNNGYLYVSNTKKHEVRRWKIGDTSETLVAGGNGEGNGLNQLNSPAFIFVDDDHSVYVSDQSNHRVMKWMEGAKEGIIVAGGSRGDGLKQFKIPLGLVVDHMSTVYVSDFRNHRVMCWFKGATEGVICAGGNEYGEPTNQFRHPSGLALDRQGNLYVSDQENHKIQRCAITQSSNL